MMSRLRQFGRLLSSRRSVGPLWSLRAVAVVATTLVGLSLSGCASSSHAVHVAVVAKEFDARRDAVWAVVPIILDELGFSLRVVNAEDGYFLAAKPSTEFSMTDHVEVFVAATGDEFITRVEVVSKGAKSSHEADASRNSEVLRRLTRRVKAGGS
jgi:hypothetical protein